MAVRSDEVADRIDAHIRESIEKMVAEIRTSIDDVREAVNQQLDAALQSVQADVKSVSFRQHIAKSVSELEDELTAAVPPPSAAPSRPDSSQLRASIQAVEGGKSQVDILNALLDQATTFASRAALLILKGEAFSGWKGVGFSAHGGNDDAIKRFSQNASDVADLDEALHDERVVPTDGATLASRMGVSAPSRAVVIPMVIKDKIAAVLYADAVEGDDRFDESSLQLLVFATGLLIDTLAIRKKIPSPSLRTSASTQVAPPAAAPEPAPAPRAAAPAPTPAPKIEVPPPPVIPRPAPASSPEPAIARPAAASPSFQLEPEPEIPMPKAKPAAAPAPSTDAFATSMMPALKTAAPAAATAPAPTVSELGERSSTQYIPPAGVTGGARFGAQQSDETKKHDEARRFARLLVSEIKLYNEAKVEQGRKNKDLYERLKEDIDRSRQMYDERIPDDVRKKSNYFYDELVRILADGDAGSLGL